MTRKTLSFTYALALTSAITSLQAQAGGLWITEFGQPTQGRAGAGAPSLAAMTWLSMCQIRMPEPGMKAS